MYVGPTLTAANTCALTYLVAANELESYTDTGASSGSGVPGAQLTLGNSQCSIALQSATVTKAGNTVSVTATITFQPWYTGTENVWVAAETNGGSNSGWQKLGTWTAETQINIGAPDWTSIMTSSAKPWYFWYSTGNQGKEYSPTNSFNTYSIPYTFNEPAGYSSTFVSQVCMYPDTSPDAPPYWYTPTGKKLGGQYRVIGIGAEYFDYEQNSGSGTTDISFGIEAQAQFQGIYACGTGSLTQTLFFHEQRCFAGHLEYGFSYVASYNNGSPVSGPPVFYYSNNTNCGTEGYTPAYCHQTDSFGGAWVNEDNPTPGGDSDKMNHGVDISDININGTPAENESLVYHAYITPNASAPNGYQFQVEVFSPSEFLVTCSATFVTTNSPDNSIQSLSFTNKPCSFPIVPDSWFPIQNLYTTQEVGFMDVGVTLSSGPLTTTGGSSFPVASVKAGRH